LSQKFANEFPKKWNSNVFLQKNVPVLQSKKGQKRAKRPNTFFRPAKLRWKSKKVKRPTQFCRSVNLKRGQIFEIWPENANLATLKSAIRGGNFGESLGATDCAAVLLPLIHSTIAESDVKCPIPTRTFQNFPNPIVPKFPNPIPDSDPST